MPDTIIHWATAVAVATLCTGLVLGVAALFGVFIRIVYLIEKTR